MPDKQDDRIAQAIRKVAGGLIRLEREISFLSEVVDVVYRRHHIVNPKRDIHIIFPRS